MAGGGWSSLPFDLLQQVSGRLTSERDLLHLRQVCSHWRASTSLPVAPYRPWVVASRARPIIVGPLGEYSLWLPRGLQRVQLAGPPGLPYCCGTPRGWLALADDELSPTRLVLWEPRSGTEIPLPPLARVIQVFLSADPLDSPSSGWMAVATQLRNEVNHNIFFWQPGDAAWSAAAGLGTSHRLHSVAFHGGKMYCMDYPKRCGNKLHGTRAAHFVTCNNEVLLVALFYDRHPSFAEVYKPDLTPGRRLEFGERVTDLGGYSLFLGRGDAFSLSPEEFPAIRRNCVYYAVHFLNTQIKDWVFVFDLESDVLEEFPFPPEHKKDPSNEWWPVSWFCPKRPIFLRAGHKPSKRLGLWISRFSVLLARCSYCDILVCDQQLYILRAYILKMYLSQSSSVQP
ncbi:uncharacterized protein LOC133903741 isoform X2 [Phragmites australis]|uniref:uncharacterized protein LOC133903741 isoform X2 n=1 Tax=Phragmites australis TaxID=29695 RepID=UPI002D78B0EB|nr:uncharacterized protein LOC133903741 isoform X2 [Phragmites australis]